MLHRLAHEFGRPSDSQAIRLRLARQTDILDTDLTMKSCSDPKDHTACLGRFFIKYMYMVSIQEFQAKGNAPRRSAHSAGNIDKQRMFLVHQMPKSSNCPRSRRAATA